MAEKKGIIAKIKGVKNIEIIIALLLCGIILLVFFSSFSNKGNGINGDAKQSLTFAQYNEQLENKIAEVLSNVDKVGNVSVLITYEGGIEQVYAYITTTQTNGASVIEKTEVVLSSGKPLIIKELSPKIKGVVIVAEGANIVTVKQEITKAVQTLLLIDTQQIQVLNYK